MLIHLEKLGKTFGEKVVLHDVTASVEREDRIGIVGADRETGERLRLETPYAPVSLPVRRLDETTAARQMVLTEDMA